MTIAEKIQMAAQSVLAREMERVSRELAAHAPIPDSSAPSLEELQRILSALEARRTSVKPYIKPAP